MTIYSPEDLTRIDSKLSKHFSFREMTKTSHRRFQNSNIKDGLEHYDKLKSVATDLLEPVRARFRRPVIVTSGYRGPDLNKAIGGSKTSQHMKAEAADFHVNRVDLRKVWKWIAYESDVMFGQLILEGWAANKPTWIHISLGAPWRPDAKCGQILTWNRADGYLLVGRKVSPGKVV